MITVSCVMPTHGRPWLVEESVQSFLQQLPGEYSAELLIVNDCPEQTLICDRPGVRIINLKESMRDLSAKFNYSVAAARGELICWWEDDDISFPGRIRYSVESIGMLAAHKQGSAFVQSNDKITHEENLFFGNVCFRKSAWDLCGGSVLDEPADLSAWIALSRLPNAIEYCQPCNTHFLYRWSGTGASHDSSTPGGNAARFQAFRCATLSNPLFAPGVHVISPRWGCRYDELCMHAVGGG